MINAFILQKSKVDKPKKIINLEDIELIIVDLFCGAGGTTTGYEEAKDRFGNKIALVIACINHDPKAIMSHWKNHPEVYHFEEDITKLYGLVKHDVFFMSQEILKLRRLVDIYRASYPKAKVVLWASLECTNFSKAKGGQPREQDSRTLAKHLDRYIHVIDPDYVKIENVVEFMAWGPMRVVCKKKHRENKLRGRHKVWANSELKYIFNKKTKKEELAFTPISKKNGQDFRKWEDHINSLGYRSQWKELDSADFGAYTTRNRLFGIFAKDGLPIVYPEVTHQKNASGESNLFGEGLRKWNAVRDLLDFEDEGVSIFGRKRPLVENSEKRIYAGLIKIVAGGKDHFLAQYNSGRNRVIDTDRPCNTIPTANRFSLVQTQRLANSNFLTKYYGNGDNVQSVNEPAGTITTKDRFSKVNVNWLDKQYSGEHNFQSVDRPAGTIMTRDKHSLVTTNGFIYNPSYGGHSMHIDQPCPTIIARQDKAPLYFIRYEIDPNVRIEIYESDSPTMVKIKEFMALYGISDIKMRMLKVSELKVIQGFPEDYILVGNQSDQKKFIGNSVHPLIPEKWAESFNKAT